VTDEESLREAIAALERAREDDRALRIQAECVSDALWLLTERGSFEHTQWKILEAFCKVCQVEDACIVSFGEAQTGAVVITTDPRFSGTQWQIGSTFRRTLEGEPIASFDVTQIAEWCDQPEPIRASVASALHIPLKSGEFTAIIVLAHAARAFFNRHHVSLSRRLARRAAQALARAQAEETEQRLRAEAERVSARLLEETSERLRAEQELEHARELAHRKEIDEKLDIIAHQRAAIRALSTPIMEVWPGILCLPVVGFVDEGRSADITAVLLDAVSATGAVEVIVDVTGIGIVDANTARYFFRITRALQLLGARCVITGVSGEVARAVVGMGLDGGGVIAYRSLRDALQHFIAETPVYRKKNRASRSSP
jgi:rsbT co-antagonist protein RsbR